MTLKQRIFGLFGDYEKLIDTNKDTNGKGTFERYNEVIGNYVDTNVTPFVDNFAQMLISPDDAFLAMLPFLEAQAGMIDSAFLSVGNTEQSRRRIVKYIADINAVKGTKRAYKILFQLLYNNFPDLQITFDEQFTLNTYDTPITADNRILFDINGTSTNCINYCTPYTINLFSSIVEQVGGNGGVGLSDGTNILSDGTNTLTDGVISITNNPALYTAVGLSDNTNILSDGTNTLVVNTPVLANSSTTLSDGSGFVLTDGTNILTDGITANTVDAITTSYNDFIASIINYNNPIDTRCVGVYFNMVRVY